MGNCFSCHKKLGIINNWRNAKTIQKYGYLPPEGMSKHDKLCASCLDVIVNKSTVEESICKDCGNKLDPNLKYCPNCKSNVKIEKPIKVQQKSAKSIKYDYYSAIFFIILGPIMIIHGLISEYPFTWMMGIFVLVISIIRYPKSKKALDRLTDNADRVSEHEENPLSVLKMRLAKSEITKEEFDKIKDDLKD